MATTKGQTAIAEEYRKLRTIHQKYLLKFAATFLVLTKQLVMQEDNNAKHCRKLRRARKRQNNVTTIELPAMSPDVNPIENVAHKDKG